MKNTKTTLATAPKIELKNVKTFRGTEGHGLNATIYVDGIKTAFIMDAADGGEPQYDVFNKEKFKQLEDYAASLPAEPIVFDGVTMKEKDGTPMTIQPSVDSLVDEVFNQLERAKQAKKLEKKMVQSVMWGVPGGDNYVEQKFRIPLSQIPAYKLQAYLNKYMSEFKPGEVFLNTNLNILGLITEKFDISDVTHSGEWFIAPEGKKWLIIRNHDTISAPFSDATDQSPCPGLRTEQQGEYDNEMTAKIVLAKLQQAAAKMAAVVS